MLMTSGVKYGLGRTLPHLAGVILGFGLMIAVVGLGLDILFQRFPQILPVMRVAGSIYMIWLALKIAVARPIGEVEAGGRPIGFLAAAGFQWVNPKAWVMALSALAAYAGVVDGYTSSDVFLLVQPYATVATLI
jgi:threonine/homoserine/homoserine lactone efflux protein